MDTPAGKRRISICCHAACMLPVLIIMGMFSYGSYSVKPSPSIDCYASASSDTPLLITEVAGKSVVPKEYVNVTAQFDTLIQWCFWMILITVLFFQPAKAYFVSKKEEAGDTFEGPEGAKLGPLPFRIAEGINGVINLIFIIMLFVYRGSHTGYVCSGYFITDDRLRDTTLYQSRYEFGKGNLLNIMMIFNAIMIPVGTLCAIVAIVMYKKNKTDNA